MKKKLLFIIILFTFGCYSNSSNVFSQSVDYKSTVKLDIGMSITGNFVNSLNNLYIDNSFASPVGQLTYNYHAEKWISIGASVGYQHYKFNLLPIDNTTTGLISANLNKLNFMVRPTLYYVNQQTINLYSGLAFGITFWQIGVETTQLKEYVESILPQTVSNYVLPKIPLADQYKFMTYMFAPQITIFGIECYVTDNFGLNAELALGSPAFLSAGLNYRF